MPTTTGPGQALFERLTAQLRAEPAISEGRMLHSPGLRVGESFFAFVGRDSRLIVKLPAARARELLADAVVAPVEIGTRVMREWVAVAYPNDPDDTEGELLWADLIAEARSYVATLT